MKKFLLPFLILLCAICCAVAIPACDVVPSAPPQTETDGNGGEIDGDNTEGNGGEIDGDNTDGNGGETDDGKTDGDGSDTDGDNTDGDDGETGHKHVYGSLFVNATCTANGYTVYTCSCGDSYTVDNGEFPALGHSLVKHSGAAASCSESGYKDYVTCRRCDYTTYEEIEPLGHDVINIPARQATCARTGWDAFEECLRCSYSTFEEIPMLEHSPEWVQRGPYCAQECSVCGSVLETSLHTFTDGKCALCGLTHDTYIARFNGSYGYDYLGTMPNGSAMQSLYCDIGAQAYALHSSGEDVEGDYCFAQVNFSKYGLDMDDAVKVFKTFRDDNPLYYWFSGSLVYTVEDLKLFVYEEYAGGEVRNSLNEEIYTAAGELCKAVGEESSAYLKALAFHDEIIEAVDYAYDGNVPQSASWAHNVLGVLQGTGAVCEGYAKTFQLLLNLCGVENIFVSGYSRGEGHVWNLVRLDDGNWYWCDVTWDDAPGYYWGISYGYFCVADESFLKNHTPDSESGSFENFLYGLPARSQSDYTGEEANLKDTFTVDGVGYTVIGYNRVSVSSIEKGGAVEIPERVIYNECEYAVIAIGEYNLYNEFSWCDIPLKGGLTSVFIPATVRFIADNSFYAISALEEINVDENNAHYSSEDGILFTKTRDILILFPNAHRSVEYAVPDVTTEIGYHAFGTGIKQGRNLETLIIHANVTAVGVANFGWGYGNIVTGEWNNIVNSLTGKKQLIIDENNGSYKVKDGLIFNYDYTYLYASMPGTQDVVIPDTVSRMDRDAFNKNHWVKSITLPEGWTSIRDHQFVYCYELESIYIPDSVTSIGDSAFFGCDKLKNVTLPENLTEIGDNVFYGCAMVSVIIPDGVTSIGSKAFGYCRNLLSVTLGAGLTEIGEDAFEGCNKLLEVYNYSELEITAGSTENGGVGFYAFYVYNGAQEESKYTVTDEGFIFFTHEEKNYLVGYVGSQTQLVLPESFNGGAYDVYGYAFFESQITSLVIPSCVGTVGEYAFYGSELKSVEIKNGVTAICCAAFMRCGELDSVIIPASVRLIESYAFCADGDMDVFYDGTREEWREITESGAFWETVVTLVYGK